jgi:ketosteroid isomerase-like protein
MTEDNRAKAIRMVETMAGGKLDDSLLTPDVQWWVPGRGFLSRAEFQLLADGFATLTDGPLTMTIHGVTADGDRVALEAESWAPLKNGKTYNNTYHFLFVFRDGRICLSKEYNDSAHAAAVLGL